MLCSCIRMVVSLGSESTKVHNHTTLGNAWLRVAIIVPLLLNSTDVTLREVLDDPAERDDRSVAGP